MQSAKGASVTFRLTTFATPLQIAQFRAKGNAKAKKHKNAPRMVEQYTRSYGLQPDGSAEFELQLPTLVHADQANGARWRKAKRASSHVDVVIAALQAHLRSIDREAITEITLTRISPGKLDAHDNLRQAFKHVLDGVCAWICVGDGELNRHAIGRYDDKLLGTGKVTCHYDQTTHETDKRLQGIRIRLRLGSPAAPSTAP